MYPAVLIARVSSLIERRPPLRLETLIVANKTATFGIEPRRLCPPQELAHTLVCREVQQFPQVSMVCKFGRRRKCIAANVARSQPTDFIASPCEKSPGAQ